MSPAVGYYGPVGRKVRLLASDEESQGFGQVTLLAIQREERDLAQTRTSRVEYYLVMHPHVSACPRHAGHRSMSQPAT